MVRRWAFVVLAAVLLATACGSEARQTSTTSSTVGGSTSGGSGAEGASGASTTTVSVPEGTVRIADFEFTPRQITVARGATVTWVNDDVYDHWVVSTQPDVLDTGELGQAQTYTKTFSQAGDYTYYCNIHNYMKATVTVR